MEDEQTGRTPDSALAELRRRLADALAQMGLSQTQLAARAVLGRTTVSAALSSTKPAPSAATVVALARALKLPEQELLALQRTAAGKSATLTIDGPGRPIGQWDPHALEVHPAGTPQDGPGLPGLRSLPGYVRREHDERLAEAVRQAQQGRSQMVVLVGESSTGKTRACWEAVQPLADAGWRLWHPFDPTRARAALEDLHRVGPRTVVWLNEAQHYLGDPSAGEEIAAAVHALLTDPQRGPILVLGTLWPDYANQYTVLPAPGEADPYSRVRELLAGRTVSIPNSFDSRALAEAKALAEDGDRLLADALTRAVTDGRLAQDLAGGPALLERYQTGSPAARALLEAAMDARRLGVGLHLPQAFLTDAAPDYLHDSDWNHLNEDWAEKAYAELAAQVHGKHAPLRRPASRPQRRLRDPSTPADTPSPPPIETVLLLADYLEQHGRTSRRHLCPPASFWHAAHTHLTHLDELQSLATAAQSRHRLLWAHHLRLRAAGHGNTDALVTLAWTRERAGDQEGAETFARQAVDHGHKGALVTLARMRQKVGDQEGAEILAQQAADHGYPVALIELAKVREQAGDQEGAETLYRQAAEHGDTEALIQWAWMRERVGDQEGAETLHRQAADHGDIDALAQLARLREQAGDRQGAETFARQAADHGYKGALEALARMREQAGDQEGAETFARQAAEHGYTDALVELARMREQAGDQEGAEALYRQAADHGNTEALIGLARMREQAGDQEGAEALYRQAADHGNASALAELAWMREEAGDREGAETIALQAFNIGYMGALVELARMRERVGDREGVETLTRQVAADHGHRYALVELARMRERAGDREGAETIARQAAAEHGSTYALVALARMREQSGDREGAETIARQAANIGIKSYDAISRRTLDILWPHGLDPDGAPTPPWQ